MIRPAHCTVALLMTLAALAPAGAQPRPAQPPGAHVYRIFVRGVPIGREEVAVTRSSEGLTITASGQLGPPLDSVLQHGEIRYNAAGEPLSLEMEGTVRGFEARLKTTFAGGKATSEITQSGQTSQKIDTVSPGTIVAPNGFFGAYAALANRLRGAAPGTELHLYVLPQMEIGVKVGEAADERIDAPGVSIAARRVHVVFGNPRGDVPADVTIDDRGDLLRLLIPAQGVDIVREDLAGVNARTATFSLPGDEPLKIFANGFTLAGTITKPSAGTPPRRPAVVLVPGSGAVDRDGFVAGIPLLGQMAGALADAGFVVVRYDKRGVGQSGGRLESATMSDFADDVIAVVKALEKRADVDPRRMAVVGHSEGAWVGLLAASREKDITALVMTSGAAIPGNDLVLEQQRHALDRSRLTDAEKASRVEMQKRIQAAVLQGTGWEGIPPELRKQADSAWFQSLLAFDPAKVMKGTRQPILIVHGELDRQVPVAQADRLAALARERKKGGAVEVVKVPGVNHLLLPAATGEVDEYSTLPDKTLGKQATSAIATWLSKTFTTK